MARITFLGTGDPLNEERAQTSLALPIGGDESLLIDTGSGSIILRQLQQAGIGLARIRHIVVSHLHFDHAGGSRRCSWRWCRSPRRRSLSTPPRIPSGDCASCWR